MTCQNKVMEKHQLLFPEHVKSKLARQYKNKHRLWLSGAGVWPLKISLGTPQEKSARRNLDLLQKWTTAWNFWQGAGCIEWHERHWRTLGIQRLPKTLFLASAHEVAEWTGEERRWCRARTRYGQFVEKWPALCNILPRHFDMLADYSDEDYLRLYRLIDWLVNNPISNLYPRQLPVAGLDSKWIEKRTTLVVSLLSALQAASDTERDFYTCCGLHPPPTLLRIRLLDPGLRKCAGGLSDISASQEDLIRLPLQIQCAFIVENLQSGLAFDDLPGTVLLMGRGYATAPIKKIPWLHGKPILYWGDLDTHGFAALSHARSYQPQIASCLMDEDTLIRHKVLWGREDTPHTASELPNLTAEEQDVYQGLKQHRWGHNVRLEQERIDWSMAWEEIRSRHFDLVLKT